MDSSSNQEARRVFKLCNVCGFCTGLCPVFPSAQQRSELRLEDLVHLANLCHNCGACWSACQYAPPHPFAIDVPATLARTRVNSYEQFAWPKGFADQLITKPLWGAVWLLIIGLIPLLLMGIQAPSVWTPTLLALGLLWAIFSMSMSWLQFWRETRATTVDARSGQAWRDALIDTLVLRHLDGGGGGCQQSQHPDHRRLAHHAVFYGFFLSILATPISVIFAPIHPLLPDILAVLFGFVLLLGVLLLAYHKTQERIALKASAPAAQGYLLLTLLGLLAVTGLAAKLLLQSNAGPILVALHLGCVLAFFVLMPLSKFTHGGYRFLALVDAKVQKLVTNQRRSKILIEDGESKSD
ncbi:citrate/tricarballylate utilization protein [Ectothiorhodosinus mongolicus]|uniref:Citrate/tricarballylate utilization protein n=1 Tax=Ectothiorhodosinus mongolicus TaxID=233100 RepID=A0A1R3VXH7_9GAMM|nr:tricarballylate utilization 4Fe-4S protein TcuB [Ectothiorhodosinus mongolicus]ULX57062.1 signal transduction protein [Ectothiorhodosinus mongolicus]SIT69700.1 citrate/tricarballylate utilization protein [Ectothiorhodosinus mongolicus]